MTLTTSAHYALVSLASSAQGGEHGGESGPNPYVVGGAALFVLLLLLWVTTRFNRDR